MISQDDSRKYTIEEQNLSDDITRRDQTPTLASPSVLAKTTTLSVYPTTASSYFACLPQSLYGTEQEGAPGVVLSSSSTFFALNLGTTVPPRGTLILATFTGNRWVFRYDA